jgi:hypothetical protein
MDHAQYSNTMKNQILSEDFRKMQKLAGIITESQLNEMNTPSAASVWDNDLTYEEKEDIALGYLDGAEDIDDVVNTPFSALRGDIQQGVEEYVSTIGTSGTSNPNAYTDDAFNYNSEIGDADLFDDEEDTFSESKISKLRQFIREEVEKELTKTEEKEIFDALEKKYSAKGVEALAKDKKYKELKKNNSSLATKLISRVRRSAEMES